MSIQDDQDPSLTSLYTALYDEYIAERVLLLLFRELVCYSSCVRKTSPSVHLTIQYMFRIKAGTLW